MSIDEQVLYTFGIVDYENGERKQQRAYIFYQNYRSPDPDASEEEPKKIIRRSEHQAFDAEALTDHQYVFKFSIDKSSGDLKEVSIGCVYRNGEYVKYTVKEIQQLLNTTQNMYGSSIDKKKSKEDCLGRFDTFSRASLILDNLNRFIDENGNVVMHPIKFPIFGCFNDNDFRMEQAYNVIRKAKIERDYEVLRGQPRIPRFLPLPYSATSEYKRNGGESAHAGLLIADLETIPIRVAYFDSSGAFLEENFKNVAFGSKRFRDSISAEEFIVIDSKFVHRVNTVMPQGRDAGDCSYWAEAFISVVNESLTVSGQSLPQESTNDSQEKINCEIGENGIFIIRNKDDYERMIKSGYFKNYLEQVRKQVSDESHGSYKIGENGIFIIRNEDDYERMIKSGYFKNYLEQVRKQVSDESGKFYKIGENGIFIIRNEDDYERMIKTEYFQNYLKQLRKQESVGSSYRIAEDNIIVQDLDDYKSMVDSQTFQEVLKSKHDNLIKTVCGIHEDIKHKISLNHKDYADNPPMFWGEQDGKQVYTGTILSNYETDFPGIDRGVVISDAEQVTDVVVDASLIKQESRFNSLAQLKTGDSSKSDTPMTQARSRNAELDNKVRTCVKVGKSSTRSS